MMMMTMIIYCLVNDLSVSLWESLDCCLSERLVIT